MLYSIVGVFCFAAVVMSDLDFQEEVSAVVDKCFNRSSIFTDASSIFRCTNYSIWRFDYNSDTCSGPLSASQPWAGCVDSGMMYNFAQHCGTAQTNSIGDNCQYVQLTTNSGRDIYPLNTCINIVSGGGSPSYQYTCYDDTVYHQTFNEYDCQGGIFPGGNVTASFVESWSCGGNNCGVKIAEYDEGSNTCNYQQSSIKPPSALSSSYIQLSNGGTPYAVGVCNWEKDGYSSRSWKYACTDSGSVQLEYFLGNDKCLPTAPATTGTIIAAYSPLNYTIVCNNGATSATKGAVGVLNKDCSSLGTSQYYDRWNRYRYCEICPSSSKTSYAFGLCQRQASGPVNSLASFEMDPHVLTACVSSSKYRSFSFLDDKCKTMDTYYEYDLKDYYPYYHRGCLRDSASPSFTQYEC
jgi:hypothetical protein